VTSSTIVAIDGSAEMGVIALANESHEVFLCWVADTKCFFSFPIECDRGDNHRIRLLATGIVAVTCEGEDFRILLFSFMGRRLVEFSGKGKIRSLVKLETREGDAFLVLGLASGEVRVIDSVSCGVCAVLEERAVGGLVAVVDDTRRLLIVVENGEEWKLVLVPF
jgi:hypothetical protein